MSIKRVSPDRPRFWELLSCDVTPERRMPIVSFTSSAAFAWQAAENTLKVALEEREAEMAAALARQREEQVGMAEQACACEFAALAPNVTEA